MAKYNKWTEPSRKAKEYNNIVFNKKISEETTLKALNKARENNRLYSEGRQLAIEGIDIETAIDLVNENGHMIPKKDHRNFKAGYIEGLKVFKEDLVNKEKDNKTR